MLKAYRVNKPILEVLTVKILCNSNILKYSSIIKITLINQSILRLF